MKIINGFFMAWGNFCAVPCPYRPWDEGARKHMLTMFPVLGLFMGAGWYLLAKLLIYFMAPAPVEAVLLTIYPFLVSGCMHLDGFMDCSDAIGSRAPLEKKLQILKDSHVGAFAVIWLVIGFLLMFSGMWTWVAKDYCLEALIVIPMASRSISAMFVLGKKSLSTSQYSTMEEGVKIHMIVIAVLLAAVSAVLALVIEPMVLPVIAAGILASVLAILKGIRQLGGMSGDISGYGIVWGGIIAVLAAAVLL